MAADSALDKRIDWRYLDLRRPDRRLIFEVQTTVERAMRQGLFTSHGYLHHHQRELLQGAYAHEHVASFGGIIARWGGWLRDRWRAGAEMDLEAQLEQLVVRISLEILLGEASCSGVIRSLLELSSAITG